MSVSRTQWCCLVAVLAVVLGLFCGPATAVVGVEGGGGRPVASDGPVKGDVSDGPGAAVASATDRHGTPGCGKSRKHEDGEPALPGRARAAHDQAPGLAAWGLPAATGQGPAHPPVRIGPRGPVSAAPTPVELSVLRV
ncbi:hypothetical protein ACFU8Q_22885 [Streptomyces sp. NPDC057543]|uniref:hypothetical protein n=1 Tax=Streptomyces sp. NPDC057543 TaxID=3346163 RepID=UPI0036AF1544